MNRSTRSMVDRELFLENRAYREPVRTSTMTSCYFTSSTSRRLL